MISPTNTVVLCNVPFSADMRDVMRFENETARNAYFSSRQVYSFSNYQYSQKDGRISVNISPEQVFSANYLYYNNADFGAKIFFAFIERVEWRSAGSADIYIKTDPWQTWFFDLTFYSSFIIREHVSNDTVGLHTIDEGLDLGEHIVTDSKTAGLGEMAFVVATTVDHLTKVGSIFDIDYAEGGIYSGIYSGLKFWALRANGASVVLINNFLKLVSEAGIPETTVAVYMCPQIMLNAVTDANEGLEPFSSLGKKISVLGTSAVSPFGAFTPKNNKLYTSPYLFQYVHNNKGSAAVFPFEHFNGAVQFELFGSTLPNPSFKIAPKNYKGQAVNYDEAISIDGYPMCAWQSDAYAAWLAQSGASTAIGTAGSLLGAAVGLASGSAPLMIGGVLGAASSLAKWKEAELQPVQARGNAVSGGANAAVKQNDFHLMTKAVRPEIARVIDDYFSMYGYKVNRLKTIEWKTRTLYNFFQINDLNVSGAVPSPDIKILKDAFKSGVTVWHTPNVGDYSANNAMVTP